VEVEMANMRETLGLDTLGLRNIWRALCDDINP
jgi:hypothetical protein